MSSKIQNRHQTTRRHFLVGAGAGLAGAADVRSEQPAASPATGAQPDTEPDMAAGLEWWSELPNKWTPVGWKNHLLRFNVLFNGTIVAQPDLNRRTEQWKGQGLQLEFLPSNSPQFRRHPDEDDGQVIQRWKDGEAPVLRSEWAWDGLLLRQELFAHMPGGKEIESGVEPLFAWVRLSIYGSVEGLPREDRYGFAIKLNAPHISRTMSMRNNLVYRTGASLYPRSLSLESGPEHRLLEEDGKVRLGIAPGQGYTVSFEPKRPTQRDSLLYLEMDVREGAHADLLLPMLPAERDMFDRELALGYDKALEEANRYWSGKPETAALVDTGEQHVDKSIRHSLKSVEVIAERDPATGDYSLLTGSWTYANVWATPLAMTCVLLLDNLGYYPAVARYLQVFKRAQGTVVPPGDAFRPHPGYLATPKSLTAVNWLTDHGALLWAISTHALVSGDREFIEEWAPVVLKACEFIKDARRLEGHGGFPGIMPPAVATDRQTKIQAMWSDGWMYKGLTTAVRLLERLEHPRAAEFAAEAGAYKEAFVRAIRKKTGGMPEWTDSKGGKHRLVPASLSGETGAETRHAFYLDTGPLFLVFSGLMDAEDELMRSTRLWFREGPPTKVYRYDSSCWQLPSLHHEMSSCEPCYSWNLFHSYQAGDREKFLEGIYSISAGAVSRQTFTVCETRGGITGLTPCLPPFYLARLSVIDDQIEPGALHLLRLAPLAWLRTERECRFGNVPTEFGPVSVATRLSGNRRELQVSYSAKFRTAPKRVVLHVPPVEGLRTVTLNKKQRWPAARGGRIVLQP